jgi:hypothetical protein
MADQPAPISHFELVYVTQTDQFLSTVSQFMPGNLVGCGVCLTSPQVNQYLPDLMVCSAEHLLATGNACSNVVPAFNGAAASRAIVGYGVITEAGCNTCDVILI